MRYKEALEAVLVDGYVTEEERTKLKHKRIKFDITEEQHIEMLTELGWTREKFEVTSELHAFDLGNFSSDDLRGSMARVPYEIAKLHPSNYNIVIENFASSHHSMDIVEWVNGVYEPYECTE